MLVPKSLTLPTTFHTIGIYYGPYYWHHLYPQNPDAVHINVVEILLIKTQHKQMGYLNWDAIKQVCQEDSPLIRIKLNSSEPHGTCKGCIVGKEKCCTFKSSSNQVSSPLEIIHSDIADSIEALLISRN